MKNTLFSIISILALSLNLHAGGARKAPVETEQCTKIREATEQALQTLSGVGALGVSPSARQAAIAYFTMRNSIDECSGSNRFVTTLYLVAKATGPMLCMGGYASDGLDMLNDSKDFLRRLRDDYQLPPGNEAKMAEFYKTEVVGINQEILNCHARRMGLH